MESKVNEVVNDWIRKGRDVVDARIDNRSAGDEAIADRR
jgi:hypothetical protein